AAIKQPDQRSEGEEQNGPSMDRREGEHGKRAETYGEEGTSPALQSRDPSDCPCHVKAQAVISRSPSRGGESSDTASSSLFAFGCWRAVLWLGLFRGQMQAELLDAARVGLQHLELHAARMGHPFSPPRNAPGEREDETAQRID